jgi:hypothetical protein
LMWDTYSVKRLPSKQFGSNRNICNSKDLRISKTAHLLQWHVNNYLFA